MLHAASEERIAEIEEERKIRECLLPPSQRTIESLLVRELDIANNHEIEDPWDHGG